ncbi:MAG: hypothetical protein OEY44_00690 [Candidatus Peregrinibacteria bacterium]|nr:hypothetical protein [Candidatus Peregrinibacteria bacterium]
MKKPQESGGQILPPKPFTPYSVQKGREVVNQVITNPKVQQVLATLSRLQANDPRAAMALLEGIDNALRGESRASWPLPLSGLNHGELQEIKAAGMKPGMKKFNSAEADPMASYKC